MLKIFKLNSCFRSRNVTVFSGSFGMLLLLAAGGCSSYQPPRPQARASLPEITRPQVRRPPAKPVKRNTTVAKVERYTDKPKTPVITQREVQAVLPESLPEKPTPVVVRSEASPYESIPDSETSANQEESSPAVKSLMIRARADMAIGLEQSAISKLERALRIEPSNADLWYLLAKAHQSSGEHQQAISMAKKSISFAGSNEAIAVKSWKLIKKSGEASGDTIAVKEAINYSKFNP